MNSKNTHAWSLLAIFILFSSCAKKGCTDPIATNYNPEAKKNNGTCIYNPGIKLNGTDIVCIPLKGSYIDEGASAIDADGSKPMVSVENQVNTAKKGNYQVRYSAELQSGVVEVTRKVIVAIDRSNWVGTWKTNDDCGSIFFPDSMVTFVLGNQEGLVKTTDMFDMHSPGQEIRADVYGQQISIPQQYINAVGLWTTRLTAVGEMNDEANAFKIKFSYKNLVWNSAFGIPGTCILKYTKVE